MANSVKSYILNHLKAGSAVAIVAFDHVADLLAPMTEICNLDEKNELNEKVPTRTGGDTGIGAGLQKCHAVSM